MTSRKNFTVPDFAAARRDDRPIAMLTAYDYTTAKLLDEAGIDVLLVGDSLGMVIQGESNSLGVTIEDIIYHSRCVARGASRALVIADMPFMSYQVSPVQAVTNAGRLIKEGRAHAVKLEGGLRSSEAIEAICRADIPVLAHIGMTPQSVHRFGGFRVQRDEAGIVSDALAVEEAGAFGIVLECVPVEIAAVVRQTVKIPIVGIGAGVGCDGQVLVLHDLLAMFSDFRPKFVRVFGEGGALVTNAVQGYIRAVRERTFPGEGEVFH